MNTINPLPLPLPLPPVRAQPGDASAEAAANAMALRERIQDLMSRWGTPNRLTGTELAGDVARGTFDNDGNERAELQIMLSATQGHRLDAAGGRVRGVIEQWIGRLDAQGRSDLSASEKTAMMQEMSWAARPRPGDDLSVPPSVPFTPVPPPFWSTQDDGIYG